MEKKQKIRSKSRKSPNIKKQSGKKSQQKISSNLQEDTDNVVERITNVRHVIERMKIHGIDGSNPPNMKPYLALRSKNLEHTKLKVPNLEVRYTDITKIESIFEMVEDARKWLQRLILQEIFEEKSDFMPYFKDSSRQQILGFSDLSKVILVEDSPGKWSYKLVFRSDLNNELDVSDYFRRHSIAFDRRQAESMAGMMLGSLLYSDELETEYGWRQRFFLYGSLPVIVGRDIAEATRAMEPEELNEFFSLDTLNDWCRNFGKKFGVELSEESIKGLNDYDNFLLHMLGGLALRHGKRVWPFNSQN